MTVYKAKKGVLIHTLLSIASSIPLIILILMMRKQNLNVLTILISLIPLALFSWIYFDTGYKILNGKLIYRSAFLRGSIVISQIQEIAIGKTMWVGIKPAMAQKGLIIRFNRYEEIYIAPENNQILLSDLVELNKAIKVVDRR